MIKVDCNPYLLNIVLYSLNKSKADYFYFFFVSKVLRKRRNEGNFFDEVQWSCAVRVFFFLRLKRRTVANILGYRCSVFALVKFCT